MAKPLPVCKHRHTPISHPNCFPKYWYEEEGHRVGYLDIEASGLSANQARMLSWAIKENNGVVKWNNLLQEEFFVEPGRVNVSADKRIVRALLDEMKEYTVLVTYYGTGFDLPFIRTRAMYYRMKFPGYGTMFHIDLFYHVRNKMSLNRNSLEQATKHLDIAGKTKLDFTYWGLAAMGDSECMAKLIDHNIADVDILEKLHRRIEPYCKFTRKSV